jgi:hypothetical protein
LIGHQIPVSSFPKNGFVSQQIIANNVINILQHEEYCINNKLCTLFGIIIGNKQNANIICNLAATECFQKHFNKYLKWSYTH